MNNKKNLRIIIFDGVCNLCDAAINFVIKRDRSNVYKFATIQEQPGTTLLKKHHINSLDTDSIVLIENNTAYVKSTAALKIAKQLS